MIFHTLQMDRIALCRGSRLAGMWGGEMIEILPPPYRQQGGRFLLGQRVTDRLGFMRDDAACRVIAAVLQGARAVCKNIKIKP